MSQNINRIVASILFDASYIEPALVTAYELIQHADYFKSIVLIYADGGSPDDNEAKNIIYRFVETFSRKVDLRAIQIRNHLPQINRYHFNNTIIYKVLIPSVLPQESYVLNFDAGILIGDVFDQFMRELNEAQTGESDKWVIAAHCFPSSVNLPIELRKFPYNDLYPAGTLLLFNVKNYIESKWQDRYLSNYLELHNQLGYAEQELMCITSMPDELRPLPFEEKRKVWFLGSNLYSDNTDWRAITEEEMKGSIFFKFFGSIKPWKYWCLDPARSIYLSRRSALEREFRVSDNLLIEKHRSIAGKVEWIRAYQLQYERRLK